MSLLDRVHNKTAVLPDGCWIWTGSLNGWGYGQLRSEGRQLMAHRITYEAKYGPVPAGLVLDHFFCDQPACVNPDHVRPATQKQNVLRSRTAVAAVNARKTHCKYGHPLSGENLVLVPLRNGTDSRRCRECHNRTAREYQGRARRAKKEAAA